MSNKMETRLHRLERQVDSICPKTNWIIVSRNSGTSKKEDLELAGHPAEEKNRGIFWFHRGKSQADVSVL